MEPYRLFDNPINDDNDSVLDEMNCFDDDDNEENYESEHNNAAESIAHL